MPKQIKVKHTNSKAQKIPVENQPPTPGTIQAQLNAIAQRIRETNAILKAELAQFTITPTP